MSRTMKMVFILLILAESVNLYSQNVTPINDSSIVYMLPYHVDSLLMRSADSGKCFFYLSGSFKHYQIQVFKISNDILLSDWLKSTYRFVFLTQKFYPLLIETDQLFGSIADRRRPRMKRFNRRYLSPEYSLATIDFTYDGVIISSSIGVSK
jgi:hypothetical protein